MRDYATILQIFRPFVADLLQRYADGAVVEPCEYRFAFAPADTPQLPAFLIRGDQPQLNNKRTPTVIDRSPYCLCRSAYRLAGSTAAKVAMIIGTVWSIVQQ